MRRYGYNSEDLMKALLGGVIAGAMLAGFVFLVLGEFI